MPENIIPPITSESPVSPVPNLASESVQNFAITPPAPHKKIPFFLVCLIIILTAVAAFAIYLFLQVRALTLEKTSPSPTPTPVASIDPTANWQTYNNDIYNFSLRYPKDWEMAQYLPNSPDVITFQSKSSYDAKSTTNSIVLDVSQACLNTQCLTKYSLDEMVNKRSATKISEIKVGDLMIYKTKLTAGDIAYMFINDNDFIQLSTDDQFDILDQILSTFKFIDSDDGFCTTSYPVETNTEELTADQHYAQECGKQESQTGCLSVDIYNLDKDDFSTPDGTPDCLWKSSPNTCKNKGKTYTEGQSFKIDCNTCGCNNGQIQCTLMACE